MTTKKGDIKMPAKITSKLLFATSIFLLITAAAHAQNIHSAVAQGDLEEVKTMLDADPLLVNREDDSRNDPDCGKRPSSPGVPGLNVYVRN